MKMSKNLVSIGYAIKVNNAFVSKYDDKSALVQRDCFSFTVNSNRIAIYKDSTDAFGVAAQTKGRVVELYTRWIGDDEN